MVAAESVVKNFYLLLVVSYSSRCRSGYVVFWPKGDHRNRMRINLIPHGGGLGGWGAEVGSDQDKF